MVAFKADEAWVKAPDRRGAPLTEVPEILAEWLEHTYSKGTLCEIPADEDDAGTEELLRAARIYCDRQGRKFHSQFIDLDGVSTLQFKMRDKRPYQRKRIPR